MARELSTHSHNGPVSKQSLKRLSKECLKIMNECLDTV